MSTCTIQPMTREMCHEFYKGFVNDPAIGHYYEYIYTPEIADRYFDTNSVPDRRLFAIFVDGQIVGECKLKNIDLQSENVAWASICGMIPSKKRATAPRLSV